MPAGVQFDWFLLDGLPGIARHHPAVRASLTPAACAGTGKRKADALADEAGASKRARAEAAAEPVEDVIDLLDDD